MKTTEIVIPDKQVDYTEILRLIKSGTLLQIIIVYCIDVGIDCDIA